MRHCFLVILALAMLGAGRPASAASQHRLRDDSATQAASPQVDESQNYQSCSQGDAPLISDFRQPGDPAWNTYMHYSVSKHGRYNDILMWGMIDQCDEPRLREVLQREKPIGTISLWSPGGALEEALAMGRTLHAFGATTLIQNGTQCISACNFVFMGGVVRMMEPEGAFYVHMFDNDAADTLQAELVNPPPDLVSFIRLFPFRSDLTIQEVDDEVQQRNQNDAKYLPVLEQIDHSEEAELVPQSTSAPTQLATNSAAGGSPGTSSDAENSADDYCNSLLDYTMSQNATVAEWDSYHKTCIDLLSRPYTESDWFSDAARTEDVKQIQQHAAQTAAEIARYLSEMSISLRFLTQFANIPNSQPRQLSIDDLRDLNVVNAD